MLDKYCLIQCPDLTICIVKNNNKKGNKSMKGIFKEVVNDWVPAYKELKSSRETVGKIHKRSTAADRTGYTNTTVAGLVLATCSALPRSYPHYPDATEHLILLALYPSFSHFSPTSIQVICHLQFPNWSPCFSSASCPASIPPQTILHPAARIMCLNTHHNFTPVQNPPKLPISQGIQNRSSKGPESLGSSPEYLNNFLSYYFPVKWSNWRS